MIIVKPEIVTAAKLTASNVPIDDFPMWDAGTNYLIGDRVVYGTRIYESLTHPNIGNQPDIQPTHWLDIGAVNRYRMFDAVVDSQTTNMGTIDVTITPGIAITAVVLFNVDAASIRVVGRVGMSAPFYDKIFQLQDYSGIGGWFDYFYAPVGERLRSEIAFLDIPAVGGASYQIILDNGSSEAKCGELVLGQQTILGVSGFGASVGIVDYSRKQTDDFGNTIVVQRRFANKGSFDVLVDTDRVAFVKRKLTEVRAMPVVYIADPNRSETIFYGFYKDFNIVIEGPVKSRCALEIEGLT